MRVMFRLERKAGAPTANDLLGYEWLDVLAIVPWALAKPDAGYGPWCNKVIRNMYICNTEHGLARITDDDLWAAIERKDLYGLVATARAS